MPYDCNHDGHDGYLDASDYEFNAGFDYRSEAYRATSDDVLLMAAAEAHDEAELRFYLDFWGSEYGPYADPGSSVWSVAEPMGEYATEYGPYVAPTSVDPLSTYFF
ncbi:hypothetical protein [uncultured Bosea sp.]|uniref:hypothetical protein n=1 Tax=uncultured Bosea sp. TaxID=211457 RepID=UPI0025DCEE88|nr:hypothetical protein [uncultured Bosea sp.]